MLSNVEFKGAMSENVKFDGEKPLSTPATQDGFSGATASKPPSPGFSN